MRPGESFAARYACSTATRTTCGTQFNTTFGRETAPKHDSVGVIYVPEQAHRAVLDKPRRLGDDVIFRENRGQQFRQETLQRAWEPVRAAFMARLSAGPSPPQRLAVDPTDSPRLLRASPFGACYMLNVLEIEPWVIAQQLRHGDDGQLVVSLYGHPTRTEAIKRIRRAYGANVQPIRAVRDEQRREETA